MRLPTLCALFAFALTALTQPAPAAASQCDGLKLAALGKRTAKELACHAKAARKGQPIDDACRGKAETALEEAFAKAEKKEDCSAPGNAASLEPLLERYLARLESRLRPEPDQNACAAKKLAAAAKDAAAKFKCQALAARKETAVDPECYDKSGASVGKLFAKAERKPPCFTSADASATDGLVVEAIDCMLTPTLEICTSIAIYALSIVPGAAMGYVPLDSFGFLPVAIGDEGFVELTTLPFLFNGETYSAVSVNANGYLVVGGGATTEDNDCCDLPAIPSAVRPNNVLAPFWTDLDGIGAPGVFSGTLTDGVATWQVIEWRVNVFATSSLRKFQVWLGANGTQDVSFAYDPASLPADPAGQPFQVGAENVDGTRGAGLGLGILPTQDLRITSTLSL
jgi:hypothetical protein